VFDVSPAQHTAPLPLQQSRLFADALNTTGVKAISHVFPGGRAVVVRRRWLGLGSVGVISRGPVWAGQPHTDAFFGLRGALRLNHLILNAETDADAQAASAAGFLHLRTPKQIAEISLAGGPEDWLARMHGKWRNRLRHAEKTPLVVTQDGFRPDPAHWLLAEDRARRRRLRHRTLPHAVTLAMAAADPAAVKLFTARAEGDVQAAMLFLSHGATATYHIGWSGPEGRAQSAHNLLLWHAMQTLAASGHDRIDLGPYTPAQAPGLARFQRGSGARPRKLAGTWLSSATLAPAHAIARWNRGY
jgi:CelD/BcsL family acetyltransferase involved in cellulose biosynthesis